MGVYIPGMEMPKNCWECPCEIVYPSYGSSVCGVTTQLTINNRDTRREDCPLVPVPPRGRLGDLDKLVEKIDEIWDCNDMVFSPNDHCCNTPEDCKGCKWVETKNFIRRMVANAPTIIPAEEGE